MNNLRTPRSAENHGWVWVVAMSIGLAIALLLLLFLAQATQEWQQYERYYTWLLIINISTVVLLLLLVAWMVWRLSQRLREGKFGTRLLIKLAAIFALVGLVPGVVIYTVSYQFVSRSIEVWFDAKVEKAINAGLSLSRSTLDFTAQDLLNKSRTLVRQLGETPDASMAVVLDGWLDQLAVNDLVVWSSELLPVASAGQSRYQLAPPRPDPLDVRQASVRGFLWRFEGLDDNVKDTGSGVFAAIRLLVAIPPNALNFGGTGRVLMVVQRIPEALVGNAQAVVQANREYQERLLGRDGLKRMYLGTLTLSLILGVFGAVMLAALLGTQLTRPLLLLAQGVRDVSLGDLSPKPTLQGHDELYGLTRSFAQMTQQLLEARSSVEQSIHAETVARAKLQATLDNMSAGVLIMEHEGVVVDANPAAAGILRQDLLPTQPLHLKQLTDAKGFGNWVLGHFLRWGREASEADVDHWQASFELDDNGSHVLLARGVVLPNDQWLLVFDDISDVVAAQRARAWGEVARRLAHEIKNPLTPIQLSAERLAMKLEPELTGNAQALLHKSVKTIVDQVDAMKRLVNEFRDYDRLPQAQLKPLDLNVLVRDVLMLYDPEGTPDWIRLDLAADLPCIQGDAQQLRQVLHNLLQNAQEATTDVQTHPVTLSTQWARASSRVRLQIQDQGQGFDEQTLQRAFEPYVTTKIKGTGLGLAVVKKIMEEHGARISLSNREHQGRIAGAQVSLSFPLAIDDQSKG